MNQTVSTQCESCGHYFRAPVTPDAAITCPQCKKNWTVGATDFIGVKCPICGCKGFYVQKDFNQMLGCAVMLVGIILVPFTYGLSLPAFALIDYLIYKRIGDVAVCYRCRAEYRGFAIPAELEPFEHFQGMKYEPKKLHLKRK